MQKLNCIVCDNPKCLKVCQIYKEVKGKKRILHYCSDKCELEHRNNKND